MPDDLDEARRGDGVVAPGDTIPPHNPMCYGCGPRSPHGLHVSMTAGEGVTATGDLLVEPRFEGGPGVIHGGILATVFDESMGLCLMLLGLTAVTVVLDIDYARPIPIGTRLRVGARVLGTRRRQVYAEATATVLDSDGPAGDPVAGAHGLFVIVDPHAHFGPTRDLGQKVG
ncbi:PaaI family thioesterase [Williamsia sp. MIQD14]|uniref:PaaI family thioesterase n=1 Tax=Williamsia sp. MIQD14 TaxID=3425703 RepID=UPI003DA18C6D